MKQLSSTFRSLILILLFVILFLSYGIQKFHFANASEDVQVASLIAVLQYPPDTVYTPISTTIPTMPNYLSTFIDTTTNIQIKRISQPEALYGPEPPTHSYSKNQPWNADATLYKFYTVAIYDAETHQLVKNLAGLGLYESFWSNTDPDLLYSFREDGVIQSYRISTGETAVLDNTLSGYDRVQLGPGEGNIDIHDKYVALVGKDGVDLDVIVFDLQEEKVISITHFAGAWGVTDWLPEHFDWVSVSQSGNYVVMSWISGRPWDVQPFDEHSGIEVYNTTDMSYQRRIVRYGNHGDLCFTPSGEEVYVQFWGDNGTINAYHLDDGQVDVIQTHTDFGEHLSCRNILRPGWAYASTTQDNEGDGMIVAVKLDDSGTIEYFGHHFSTDSSYKKSPMPVPSPNGSVVMFKSDFGDGSDPLEAYAFEATAVPWLTEHIMLPIIFNK